MDGDLYTKQTGVVASELDTLIPGECLLVSNGRKHYQLAGLARAVVLSVDHQPLTFEQIREQLQVRGSDCAPDRLAATLDRLVELSILSSPNSPPPERTRQWKLRALHRYLTLKVNLFSADLVAPFTRRLAILFSLQLMQWSLPAMLALQIAFCWAYFGSLVAAIPKLDAISFGWLVAGNYAALLLHELGHASACIANGVRHGPIGFCLYLILPAFYADVSEAWRLPRRRRAVVDGGGIFMSLLCATAFSAMFLLTGGRVWGLLSILCDITVLWNINPFLRMDGYWLVSDWLGVQNLMTVNKDVSWWIVRKAFCQKAPRPMILSSGYRFRVAYAAYYIGFLLFFGYFWWRLGVNYLPALMRGYPDVCWKVLSAIVQPQESWLAIPTAAWHWLVFTVPLLGLLLLFIRFLGFMIDALAGVVPRHRRT